MNPEDLLRSRLAAYRLNRIQRTIKQQKLLDTAPRAAQYQGYQVDGGGIVNLLGGSRLILAPVTNGLVLPGQGVNVRSGSFDAAPYVRNEPVEPENKKELYPFVVLFAVRDDYSENQPYVSFYVGGHKKESELVFKIAVSDISVDDYYRGFVHNYGDKYEVSILYKHRFKGNIVINIYEGKKNIIESETISLSTPSAYVPTLYKGNLISQVYESEPMIELYQDTSINQPIPSLSVSKSKYYLSDSLLIYSLSSQQNVFYRSIAKDVNYNLPFIDSEFKLSVTQRLADADSNGNATTGYKSWVYENLNLFTYWREAFIYEKVNYEQKSTRAYLPVGAMLGTNAPTHRYVYGYRPTSISASQKYYLLQKSESSPLEIDSDKNVFILSSSNKLNLSSNPRSLQIIENTVYPIDNSNYEFYPSSYYLGKSVLIAENDAEGCFLAKGAVSGFQVTDSGKSLIIYAGDFYPASNALQIIVNITVESITKVPYVSFSSEKGTVIVHDGSFNSFLLTQQKTYFSNTVDEIIDYKDYPGFTGSIYMNKDSSLDFCHHRRRLEFLSQSIVTGLAEVQIYTHNSNFLHLNKTWLRNSVYVAQVPKKVKTQDTIGYAEEWRIGQDGKMFRQDAIKSEKVYSLGNQNASILSVSYYPVK